MCEQLFKQRGIEILKTVSAKGGKSKLAVVVDLDETVLDNSQYQVEGGMRFEFYSNSWSNWVNGKSRTDLKDKEFLTAVRKKASSHISE